MSYDIIVFDPERVATDKDGFTQWLNALLTGEDAGQQESAEVRDFHDDLRARHPETIELDLADDAVIVTLPWEKASAAVDELTHSAPRRGLGVYDYSGTRSLTLPPRNPAVAQELSPASGISQLLKAPAPTGQACRTRGGTSL